ncbi:MAG: MotA/TolQ/ExbB proton channel family protein [Chitinispirillaceae bacterium]|nr:MotA/TolQ/ExbB proton channel family protein [Chitinispirillaceae bacterium]
MKLLVLTFLILPVTLLAAKSQQNPEQQALINELQQIKTKYESGQANLRRITDNRWTQRQEQIDRKQQIQQSIENTQAAIERIYTEVARIREEILFRDNNVTTIKSESDNEKERYQNITTTIEGLLQKEEDVARSGFPVGQQERALEIQNARRDIKNARGSAVSKIRILQKYITDIITGFTTTTVSRETVVLPDHSLNEIPVVRLGSVLAIGASDTGDVFYLCNTGNVLSPFEWVKITEHNAAANIQASLPRWLADSTLSGSLFVDVLQNSFSSDLIGIGKKTWQEKVVSFVRSGGVVMYPLGLICLWALVLLLNRLFVYSASHSRGNRFIDQAIEFLNQKKFIDAERFAGRSRGVLARILITCLDHSRWKRPAAEKAVKELLLAEVPALDKHLDTLAVLAGAAPLLGLLGTVTGMIGMFESITRFGTGDPKLMAGGISEALVTTEVGLAIAIPLLLIHNFLRNRRNHIQADMEMYAMRIFNRLWPEE